MSESILHPDLVARCTKTLVSTTVPLARMTPSALKLGQEPQLVTTGVEAAQMVSTIENLDVAYVGFDTEYRFAGTLGDGTSDPTTLLPICLSLALVTRDRGGALVPIAFVIDLRRLEVRACTAEVLRMPYTFVAHYLKAEFMAIAKSAIHFPRRVACTWLAARLLSMGRHHARYLRFSYDEGAVEAAAAKAAANRKHHLSLLACLSRLGLPYTFGGDKKLMRERFLILPDDEELSANDCSYAAADAIGAAALYRPLRNELIEQGLDAQYDEIELPALVEFAEIERRGVTIDLARAQTARSAAQRAQVAYEQALERYGFSRRHLGDERLADAAGKVMVGSFVERKRVLGDLGLINLFATRGTKTGYSFNRKQLKQHRSMHDVINRLYQHSMVSRTIGDPLFSGELVCRDSRVHPILDSIGADSGRVTARNPNILGIGRVNRPIVIPSKEGRGLLELDYSTQEPMIAASVFGDAQLLRDCNHGDVYCQLIGRILRKPVISIRYVNRLALVGGRWRKAGQ